MCRPLPILATILALSIQAHASAADGPATKKIILIGHKPDHPFGSHMYLHECGLLAKCLNQTKGIEAVVADGWPNVSNAFDGVAAIVFYSGPAGNLLLTGPHAKQAEQLLADGVGYTALHWGTGAMGLDLGKRYLNVLGGWFDTKDGGGGLAVVPTKLVKVGDDHPIFRGWNEFPLRDEIYLRTQLAPEAKTILKVTVNGTDQVVGWVYNRPGSKDGRSFGLTLGHFHDNFGMDEFRRVIVNGVLWTAHVDVPESGAPVQVTAKDLDIGPPPEEKKKN